MWTRAVRGNHPTQTSRQQLMLIVALLITFAWTGRLHAQAHSTIDTRREYNVKAVNIYGFCRFVRWPADAFSGPSEELTIGIFGSSPIEAPLKAIAAKKKVQARKLKIVHCNHVEDALQCHIVFVPRSRETEDREKIIKNTANAPIMLVGESSEFGRAGGVANFYVRGTSIRFELNSRAAQNRGLRLDAKLLSLGTEIKN